jgi:hypothetical protein
MTRLYGLFERQGGKWVRLHPTIALPKQQAVRLFQGALLDGALGAAPERSLRPVGHQQHAGESF